MNNTDFCKSFLFAQFTFQRYRHNHISPAAPTHYLGYLHEGYGRLQNREITLEVEPGDLFYIPKGCSYHSYWHNDGDIRFDSFGFLHFPFADNSTYSIQRIPVTEEIHPLLLQLSAHKEVDGLSVGLLYQILQLSLPQMVAAAQPSHDRLAALATHHIQCRPKDTIAAIAAACGVSEGTLYSCFRRVYGKTPTMVRQEYLVQQAVGLLTTTDLSVEKISEQLGFSSPAYFRKVFRQHTNSCPRQWRRQQLL